MSFYFDETEGMNTQVLAVFLAAIAYGLVIALSFSCWRYLYRTTHIYSRRMLIFLYLYVLVMISLSTAAVSQEIAFTQAVVANLSPALGLAGTLTGFGTPVVLPFLIWGADSFMASQFSIWRCWILYQGIASALRIGLICVLTTLGLVSLASGILLFVFDNQNAEADIYIGGLTGVVNAGIHDTAMLMLACTAVVNFVLALLIALRLVHHQRYMAKALGDGHGAPYTRIINICVESCALIFVTSIASVGAVAMPGSNKYLIPLLLLPHVCVLSPLLIVYRVAQGRSATSKPSETQNTITAPPGNVGNNIRVRLEPIRFQKSLSAFESTQDQPEDESGSSHPVITSAPRERDFP